MSHNKCIVDTANAVYSGQSKLFFSHTDYFRSTQPATSTVINCRIFESALLARGAVQKTPKLWTLNRNCTSVDFDVTDQLHEQCRNLHLPPLPISQKRLQSPLCQTAIVKKKVCFIVKAVYLSRDKVSNFYHFHLRLQHIKIQNMDTWSTKERLFWSFIRKKESADYQERKADGFGGRTAR